MASLSELGWVYVALLVVFALIFVAVIVALARQHRDSAPALPPPPPATSGTLREAMAAPGAVPDPYMVRFVDDEKGERMGETISLTADHAIVKRDGAFHAVPLESIRVTPTTLVATNVDWEKARREGEAWRAEQAAQHEALKFDETRE